VSEIIILAQVQLNELDRLMADDYTAEATQRLATVDGAQGMSVWRNVRQPNAVLIAYEYRDIQAAEKGLVALTGIRLLAETQTADFQPADVLRVRVVGRHGPSLVKSPKNSYLSMSVRVADPGYGPDLTEEIERIFTELEFIPGHVGSVFGPNDSLDEEIVGIVMWDSYQAFQSSLPPGHAPYEVRLFDRVH